MTGSLRSNIVALMLKGSGSVLAIELVLDFMPILDEVYSSC